MTTAISNSDDVIDSRDVISRIEELREQLAKMSDADRATDAADPANATAAVSDEYHDLHCELLALEALQEQCEGYCDDWQHGATLIRDSYFKEYAMELAEETMPYSKHDPEYQAINRWPYTCIDWDQAARELRMDYTGVDFDGVDYWVR